jgi:hypothetical protein
MPDYQIDKIAFNKAVSLLIAEAQKIADVEIRFSSDIEAMEDAQKELGRNETGEHFHRSIDTLPPNRFFWLGAFIDNQVYGTVAARCDESSWTLQEYAKAYWERAFEAEEGGRSERVSIVKGSPEAARKYKGRFAYLGEALTREGFRSRNLSYVLVRLALLFSFDEWRPAIAYGWMRDWHAYRGLGIRWGFNGCSYSALEWLVKPKKKDWHNLAFLTCDDLGLKKLMTDPAPETLFRAQKSTRKETEPPRPSVRAE